VSDALAEAAVACAVDAQATTSHRLQACYDCIRYGSEVGRRDIPEKGYRILAGLAPVTPDDVQNHSLGAIAFNLLYGDQHLAARAAQEWLTYERERGDSYRRSWSARWAGVSLAAIGDLSAARNALYESIATARKARLRVMLHAAHDLLIGLETDYGDIQSARTQVASYESDCGGFADEVPMVRYTLDLSRAQVAILEGKGEEALRFFPTEPATAGARLAEIFELSIRLSALMLISSTGDQPEVHEIARRLAPLLEAPMMFLGTIGASYAEYLERYHGAEAADAFTRRFTTSVWRELLPPRRLAPFVERLRLGNTIPAPARQMATMEATP
jgi:hypothetical protein